MSRNHVNAKAAKTAKKNLSKRCFAPFAIFAFNVILSQALTPPRDGAAAAPPAFGCGRDERGGDPRHLRERRSDERERHRQREQPVVSAATDVSGPRALRTRAARRRRRWPRT